MQLVQEAIHRLIAHRVIKIISELQILMDNAHAIYLTSKKIKRCVKNVTINASNVKIDMTTV